MFRVFPIVLLAAAGLVLHTISILHAQPLAAHYPLDGSANDASGNGHHGVVVGATPTGDRYGNPTGAYHFNGASLIEVPHSPLLNFGPSEDFTITAWVKLESGQTDYAGIVCKGPQNTDEPGYQLTIRGANNPYCEITRNGGRHLTMFTNVDATSRACSSWHFIALTVSTSANTVAIYVDGVVAAQTTTSNLNPALGNTRPLQIGAERNRVSYLRGSVDDVRIYRAELTGAQVQTLYNDGGRWPPPPPNFTMSVSAAGSTTICHGDKVQLRATGGAIHRWRPATGLDNPNIANPQASPAVTTKYYVTGYTLDTCGMKVDSIIVTVNPAINLTPGGSVYGCRGAKTTIGSIPTGGVPPFTYAWTPASGLDDPTKPTPTVTATTSMLYTLTVTDSKGCTRSTNYNFSLLEPPRIVLRDTILCRGSALRIGAEPVGGAVPYRYHWSPSAGLSDTSVAMPMASPDSTTTYVVSIIDNAGCGTTDTIIVRVVPAPVADAGPDAAICDGDSVTIGNDLYNGDKSYSYAWSPAGGLHDPTASTPRAGPDTTTIYTVTITDRNGCTATDQVTVRVRNSGLRLDSTAIDFGPLGECQSGRERTVTISNPGVDDIVIDSGSISNPDFTIVDPALPVAIAAGESVTFTIRYAPASIGVSNGELSLYGSPCGLVTRMQLAGRKPSAAPLRFDVPSIDLGAIPLCRGVRRDTSVVVRNSGANPVSIGAGLVPLPFTITGPALPVTVAPGDSIIITLSWLPATPGNYSADLLLPYQTGSCIDTLRLNLTARATFPAPAMIGDTVRMTFSGCESLRDTMVVIRNDGSEPVEITSSDGDPVWRLLTPLPRTIAPGMSDTLYIRCQPAAQGSFSRALTLRYQPCDSAFTIPLIATSQATAVALPDTIDFGEVHPCSAADSTIAFTYTGSPGTSGVVERVDVSGPVAISAAPGDSLRNGNSRSFVVSFTSQSNTLVEGTIDLLFQPCGIARRIVVTGRRGVMRLEAQGSLLFPALQPGGSATRDLIYTNTGTVPLTVDSIGGIGAPFTIVTTIPPLPARLAPAETLIVTVRFTQGSSPAVGSARAYVSMPCQGDAITEIRTGDIAPAWSSISIPYLSGEPGATVSIPLMLDSSLNLDVSGAHDFTATIAYDRSLLIPAGDAPVTIVGDTAMLTVTGRRDTADAGVLLSIPFIAALGVNEATPLRIAEFAWVERIVSVTRYDGEFHLTGLCETGGRRLVSAEGMTTLKPNRPNPARSFTDIDYEVVEQGRTRLIITDLLGREVGTLVDGDLVPGRYTIRCDISSLPNGRYFYVLRTPSEARTRMMVVER